jgi:hypothetical protein
MKEEFIFNLSSEFAARGREGSIVRRGRQLNFSCDRNGMRIPPPWME